MIYFDHAATSFPKPDPVIQEVIRAVTLYGGNPGRSGHTLAFAAAEKIYEARLSLSELFFFPKPENLVFTMNATYAINQAIRAFLKPGMHVLIGNREHNAVFRPIARLAREGVLSYTLFDPMQKAEALSELLLPNTGLLILCHVSNLTGEAANAEDYAAFCRAHGIRMILDASQSLGHMPFSAETIPADAVCAPSHKGLCGIQGAGILYFRESLPLPTLVEGGSGSQSLSPEMPTFLPDRYEAGTPPTPAIASLLPAAAYLKERGIEEIHAHTKRLRASMRDRLLSLPHVRVLAPEAEGAVLSFVPTEKSVAEIASALAARDICVRGGYHCAPLAHKAVGTDSTGAVRLSFGATNTMSEVEAVYRILREMI